MIKLNIRLLMIFLGIFSLISTAAFASCPPGYVRSNNLNFGALYCYEGRCSPYAGWSATPPAYFCDRQAQPQYQPQPQPSYSGWGGSPSAGQAVLGGLVGLLAWGLANSNSGQTSSGSSYSSSGSSSTVDDQSRREQEFIQLQRQEQQMRQYHPPQP